MLKLACGRPATPRRSPKLSSGSELVLVCWVYKETTSINQSQQICDRRTCAFRKCTRGLNRIQYQVIQISLKHFESMYQHQLRLVRPDLLAWQASKQGDCLVPKLGLRIFLEHSIAVKSPGSPGLVLPMVPRNRSTSKVWRFHIPVCIREDLDPPYPSHKTLGPNLSLYKEVSPVKIWSLQKARVNLGQGAKNRHKSDLQEGGPTLMAKLSEPSIIQLDPKSSQVLSTWTWLPNPQNEVLYKKLIDILHDWENCSKMTSLQKAMHSTWWFLELICLQVLGYQAHIAVQNSIK